MSNVKIKNIIDHLENLELSLINRNYEATLINYKCIKSDEYSLRINKISTNKNIPKFFNHEDLKKIEEEYKFIKLKKSSFDENKIIESIEKNLERESNSFKLLDGISMDSLELSDKVQRDSIQKDNDCKGKKFISLFQDESLEISIIEPNIKNETNKVKRKLKTNCLSKKNEDLENKKNIDNYDVKPFHNLLPGPILLDMPLFNPNIKN